MKKLVLMYLLLAIVWASGEAQVVVTSGTFPTMCQGQGYVTQINDIVIKETLINDFRHLACTQEAFFLNAPLGYAFEPNVGTVTCLSGRDISISSVDISAGTVEIALNTIYTFSYIDQITISGLSIKASIGASGKAFIYKEDFPIAGACGPFITGDIDADSIVHATINSIPYTLSISLTGVFCSDDNVPIPITGVPGIGTFSGSGVSGGNFISSVAGAGSKTITYTTVVSGCTYACSTNVTVKAPPYVGISQYPTGLLCPNTSVTFSETTVGYTGKRYQFFVNGIPVTILSTSSGPNYTTTSLVNGDQVSVLTDGGNGTCQKMSSAITMTFVSATTVTISLPTLPALLCDNASAGYTVVKNPTGGVLTGAGISGGNFYPSLAGAGTTTLTYLATVGGCNYTVTKDIIVTAAPTLVFTSSDADNIICEGDPVTFTANTNGTANRYLFLKDANGIQGPSSSNTYLTSSLSNGDMITVTVDNGANTCVANSVVITTTAGKIPHSAFSWKSTCGQNTITYHDLSTVTGGSILKKWDWDYTNDGTIDYTQLTSLPDAVNTYSVANSYQSRLRVTTDKGCYKDTIIRVYTLPGKTPTPTDPYAINFTSSNQGWAYDGTNSSWGWGIAPSAFGMGTRPIWSTGQNSSDGNYKVAEHSYLYGPCINFSQLDKPMIALKLSSKITANPAGAILEATSDDGLNWVKLGNIGEGLNWYNVAGIVSTPFTYLANSTDNNPNAQGWADTISFHNAKIPKLGLQNYAGNTSVRFRINFAAVANVSAPRFAGIGIDSVWIGNRNKIVMIEHFTNTCLKCPPADSAINLINSKRSKDVVSIYEHTSFPYSDPYKFDEADLSSRVLYYGLTSVPYTFMDGSYFTGNTYSGGTLQSRMDTIHLDARALVNSVFKIDITSLITTGKIDANVRVTYTDLANSFKQNVVIQVAITEDTVGGNVAANFVLWKMLPSAAGSYISNDWKPNPVKQVHETWNNNSIITSGRKFGIVVFVQNYDTKEVYQAAYIKGSGTFGSIVVLSDNEKNNSSQNLYIYPNPASTIVNIAFEEVLKDQVNWQMTDNFGKIVKEGTIKESTLGYQIDTNELANGMYYIKLANENINQIRKLIINK